MVRKKVQDFLYEKESYEIRGACFEVYKAFGGAFKEKVIDRALTKALEKQGLKIEEQKRIDIYFEGEKVGTYVPDKIINDCILLEIKVKARTKEFQELAVVLEEKVKERTKELQEKIDEMEKFQKLTVGREIKMVELKKEIKRLEEQVEKNKSRKG